MRPALRYLHLRGTALRGQPGVRACENPQHYDFRNNTVIELGTIDDQYEGIPEIATTALVDGEHVAEPAGEVTITDTVSYKNLKVGQTYKLSGHSHGQVYLRTFAGRWGSRSPQSWSFTPTSPEGTVELTYTFDASALAGKSVVVFEDLYQDESLVAFHANLEDEGQTISFGQPEIGTTATVNGEKTAQPAERITLNRHGGVQQPDCGPGIYIKGCAHGQIHRRTSPGERPAGDY